MQNLINVLKAKKISCIYGDVMSPEMLSKINIKKMKLVISTIPGYEENLHLARKIKKISPRTKVVVNGSRISETVKLYKAGADLVITPKIVAGQKLAGILHGEGFDLKSAKKKHLKHLRDIHRLLY